MKSAIPDRLGMTLFGGPKIAALLLPALLAPVTLAAQDASKDPNEIVRGPMGERLDKAVKSLAGLSGTVLVAKDDMVLLAKGYGVIDRVKKAPCRVSTLYDLGHVSDTFTAAGVLRLEMEGKLSISDPVSKHLEKTPKAWKSVTIEHLLSHKSGLPEGLATKKPTDSERKSRDKFLEFVYSLPLTGPPGEEVVYSRVGYMVLAAVIEVVAKMEFGPFVKQRLLAPLGMTASGHCGDESLEASLAAPRYEKGPPNDTQIGSTIDHPFSWGYKGTTSIVSCVGDLLRWYRVLVTDSLLSAEAREKMLTPRGPKSHRGRLAYCWWIGTDLNGQRRIDYNGSSPGFRSHVYAYPEASAFMVFLNNSGDSRIVMALQQMEAILLDAGSAADLERSKKTDHYEGEFSAGDVSLSVYVDGVQTAIAPLSQEALWLVLKGGQPKKKAASFQKKLNDKVVKLFMPLVEGKSKAFARSFPSKRRKSQVKPALKAWSSCQEALGAYQRLQVVGSHQAAEGPTTYVRTILEKGAAAWRVTWDRKGNKLKSVARSSAKHPASLRMTSKGAGEFSATTLDTNKAVKITFEQDGEKTTAVVWETSGGPPLELKRLE